MTYIGGFTVYWKLVLEWSNTHRHPHATPLLVEAMTETGQWVWAYAMLYCAYECLTVHINACRKERHIYLIYIYLFISPIFTHYYPRPVLAFGYYRCLRLSVCVSVRPPVCVWGKHLLVRAITHHPFKLRSRNLDHLCKRPWLRSLLFLGVIDLDLQGQI